MASKSDVQAGGAFVRLFLKDDLSKSLSTALKSAGSALSSFGSNAKAMGGAMMAGGAAIAAPLAGALVVGANFQDIMLDIAASTGLTSDELTRLNEAAMNAKVGPAAAAQSFLELLKAGMSLEEVLGGAGDAAIAFAKVGKMDAGEAATVMADAMKVFGVAADVAANTISAAADASSTDIEGVSMAFSQASAVAALANQSIQDVATAIALMANAGVKGSDAGTSLKSMLIALMAPSDTAASALTSVGLSTQSFRDASGNMLPMVQIIAKVNSALQGMDQASKDAALKGIFGTDAIRAAAILTSTGVEGFGAMRDGMAGALTVGEKFSTVMGGLSGTQASLLASLERIGIIIATSLTPVLQSITPYIERVAVWFGEFAKSNTWLGPALAATAVALTTMGTALVGIGMGATAIAAVVTALGTLAGFAGSFPPIVAALAGIAAGFTVLKGMDAIGIIDFGPVLESAKATAAYLAGEFMTLLSDLGRIGGEAWGGISSAMQSGDWKAAGEIAMAGLEAAIAAGAVRLTGIWNDYKQSVLDTILGTAQIAVETLAKLSSLGGPFAGLLGGNLAEQATGILGEMGAKSRRNKADSYIAAQQKQADAEARLKGLSDAAKLGEQTAGYANEFEEAMSAAGSAAAAAAPAEVSAAVEANGTEPDMSNEPGAVDISEADRAAIFDPAVTASRAVRSGVSQYSVAGAQAASMGRSSPADKMVTSINQMAKDLKDLGLLSREQTVTNQQVVVMYERFLAAFQYG